ncbi:hypothetical protein FRB90_004558 [Tulasnella sp. 427]|nr:hypothetical protein FRB90_004558 [Tulasnella sp. 427]
MDNDELQYNDPFWESILPEAIRVSRQDPKNLVARIHLIISLILYLAIPLKQLLHHIFSTKNQRVASAAGRFISRREEQQIAFGPVDLYSLWNTQYPKCRGNLEELIVKPAAKRIALAESDSAISDPKLKIKLADLTVHSVRDLLTPTGLEDKYRQHAPFLFEILETFAKSPNRYEKWRGFKVTVDVEEDESDDQGEMGSQDTGERDDEGKPDEASDEGQGPDRITVAIIFIISALLYLRNRATNILPLIFGIFAKVGGASSRVIATLNRLGVSVSARTIDRVKTLLSDDAVRRAKDLFLSNHLFSIIFDNINIYVRKSEQRVDNQNTMIHATNIALLALPPEADLLGENLQEKLAMRGKRGEDRHGDCIRLTKEDQDHYTKAFTAIVAQMLCTYWPGRERWRNIKEMEKTLAAMSPSIRPLPPHKTETYPMGVVDVNEGSKKGVVRVMEEIQKMCSLSEEDFSKKVRIVKGDLGTVRLLRSARRDRADDVSPMEQLLYIQELSELFHWALNATHMLMRVHLGNGIQDPGSLLNHKDLLGRIWDVNKPNYAAAKALLRHSLIARLLHIALIESGKSRWSDLYDMRPDVDEIQRLAGVIASKWATSQAGLAAQRQEDDVLAHACWFLRDTLTFMEFESAVSHADAGRVLKIVKLWSYMFRGAGLYNYAREALELLSVWSKELPAGLKTNLEMSWFVNRWGKPGRFIAADLYVEHLNRLVKCEHLAEGSGLTVENIKARGSSCVEALDVISRATAQFFGTRDPYRRHKEAKVTKDLQALVGHLQNNQVHSLKIGRRIRAPVTKQGKEVMRSGVYDVISSGFESLTQGGWSDFLKETTYDPALGYPLDTGEGRTESELPLSESAFDNEQNPLTYRTDEALQEHMEGTGANLGLGGVGGGDDLYIGLPDGTYAETEM